MNEDSRDQVRRSYSGSAEEYDRRRLGEAAGRVLSDHDRRLFLGMLPDLPPSARALEIGAGTGRFTLPALTRGYKILATDVNPSMCEALRRKLELAGLAAECEVRQADVFHLALPDGAFDFVFALHVVPRFVTFADQAAALASMARVARPGGYLLFNVRSSRSLLARRYGRRPDGGHLTTPQELSQLLDANGLVTVRVRGKVLLSRGLTDRLPPMAASALSRLESIAEPFSAPVAWDRFVLVRRQEAQP